MASRSGTPDVYGNDRVFVSISVGRSFVRTHKQSSTRLRPPDIRSSIARLDDLYDLGAEFFQWEFATAVAGWRLGINPFDQPNVQEAKDATKELLSAFERRGQLDERARDRCG